MQVGLTGPGGAPLNVTATVKRLLDEMRTAALRKDTRSYEARSDELATFVLAQIAPDVPQNWRKYHLTRAETIIADMLFAKRGRVIAKSTLMDALYFNRPNSEPDPKIVDIFVCKIRKKLPAEFQIETVWGIGYKMVPEGEVAQLFRGKRLAA